MSAQEIGIVGAGPAGLAALKAILDTPQYKAGQWIPTALEARETVGGVWLPSPAHAPFPGDSAPPSPPPTPLYDSLTTNLPHPIMAFTSFPFPASTPLFPEAKVVQTYLESYASHFDLHRHILLNTRVTNVDWDPAQSKWTVEAIDPHNQIIKRYFDLLLICNGHHNLPRYPSIPGLDTWLTERRASHSIFYRNPSSIPSSHRALEDQTVLVIGGGPSGSDITAELVPLARRVIHSFSPNSAAARAASSSATPPSDVETLPDPAPSRESAGAIPKPRLSRLSEAGTVHFEDGSEEHDVDHCILATGYEVDFPFFASPHTASFPNPTEAHPHFSIAHSLVPFLAPDITRLPPTELTNTSWSVFPLARHLFGVPNCGFSSSLPTLQASEDDAASSPSQRLPPPTSLAFLGLLVRVAPLPIVEVQARAALAAFTVHSSAPPSSESGTPPSGNINWPQEESKIISRWWELKAKYDGTLTGSDLQSSSSSPPPPPADSVPAKTGSSAAIKEIEQDALRAFISKGWHRFSEEALQFDYRDELDEFAFYLLAPSPSPSPSPTPSPPSPTPTPAPAHKRTRVKPWERHFYTHKLTLRKAWRELEARGVAEEWVRGVGSGELGERKPGSTREERVEAEWVKLMERVLEFGRSL